MNYIPPDYMVNGMKMSKHFEMAKLDEVAQIATKPLDINVKGYFLLTLRNLGLHNQLIKFGYEYKPQYDEELVQKIAFVVTCFAYTLCKLKLHSDPQLEHTPEELKDYNEWKKHVKHNDKKSQWAFWDFVRVLQKFELAVADDDQTYTRRLCILKNPRELVKNHNIIQQFNRLEKL